VKSFGKGLLREKKKSCIPEIAKVVPCAGAVLGNVKESQRWYWF
jgi:hypothetical protein